MAYHFEWYFELLLFPTVIIPLTVEYLVVRKFHEWTYCHHI